jgi:hypothetical protein
MEETELKKPRIMTSKDGIAWKEPPPECAKKAMRIFEEQRRKEQQRVSRFGQIRPIISMMSQGQRWVAVRNKLFYQAGDKWKYFPDFLRDYVPQVLGLEWCKAEAAKPEAERHPIITWREQGQIYMNAQPAQPDGSRVALPSGAVAAYNNFAYDLYVTDDNGGLDENLLQRLKKTKQFQGARHELFSEATCYRAGFTVQHENEKDGSTRHAEFTATHTATGQKVSVEAKSRHREGVLGRPGISAERPSFTYARLINDAVGKNPPHPLVIFLDTNLPFKWAERWLTPKAANSISRPVQIMLEEIKREHNNADPYTLLVLSNHPHHYAITELDPRPHVLSVVSQQPKAAIEALQKLHVAATLYGNIPMGFSQEEGEPPAPAVPVVVPKVRYDFRVNGIDVSVSRDGKVVAQGFSIVDKDHPQGPSKLHEFLEDIGMSPVDAHMICKMIEQGHSLQGVFALK